MKANKRFQFLTQLNDIEEIHRKYGGTLEDALFRFQIEVLKTQLDPKAFRRKTSGENKSLKG